MKKILLSLSLITTFMIGQVPTILKDINSGIGVSMLSSDMANAFPYNNGIFFLSNDGSGKSLWYSLGTTATTTKIIPVTTGTPVSAYGYAAFKNCVLFTDKNSIWMTFGTNSTTKKISTIANMTVTTTNSPVSYPYVAPTFTIIGSKAYFTATVTGLGKELFVTDTTIGSTTMLKDIWTGVGDGNPDQITDDKAGGFYFKANDGVNGDELWHSNGTTVGTAMVKDIFTGSGGSFAVGNGLLALANNIVFFVANDGVNGRELWRSDGTASGTYLLNQLTPGPGNSSIYWYTTYNNKFYFAFGNNQIHETNGFAINNYSLTLPTNYFLPYQPGTNNVFYEFNSELFVSSLHEPAPMNIDSIILFKMNGSISTFKEVKGLMYYGGSNYDAISFYGTYSNKFVMQTNNGVPSSSWHLVISDGTSAGTILASGGSYPIIPEFILSPGLYNGKPIPFISNNWIVSGDPSAGFEGLYKIDYNTLAISSVKTINPTGNFQNLSIKQFEFYIEFNNKVYFFANDGNTGMEPWVTDGTAAGTNLLLDIYPGTTPGPDLGEYFPLQKSGNCIYFVADDGINGKEPWTICSGAAGINENEIDNVTLKVYPNPASTVLNILTPNNGFKEISILNMLGQEVFTQSYSSKVDISKLNNGCYFIKITGDKTYYSKFIKE